MLRTITLAVWSYLGRHMWTGLFVVVPAWGTFLILYTLFDALDHMMVDVFAAMLGAELPGTGLASFLVLVLLSGMVMTHYIGRRIHRAIERPMEQIPLVRSIYQTLKSMADVFHFRQRFGCSKVAVIPFPRDGLWALGFIMDTAPTWLQVSENGPLLMVFVPTALHPFTGYLAFVPERSIYRIRLSPEDAIKMEFSAGLYRPEPGWLAPALESS
ncbi:MAG: DUF502 domain-containing protein [Nitrospirae bacterium]|nr:MAG: DUF502 domain-containing protein [Nitrospirota bacterium]